MDMPNRNQIADAMPQDVPGKAALVIGGLMALVGLTRKTAGGMVVAIAGGMLVAKTLREVQDKRGHGVNAPPANSEIMVEKAVVLSGSPEDVYAFWRKLENLPRFMSHLKEVTELDDTRSHWVARAPLGMEVAWDAEITEDEPGDRIVWRSVDKSTVENHGTVEFSESHDGGTEVRVTMFYAPPAGKLGATVARMLGEEPETQIEEDLQRLKQIFQSSELGEVPSKGGSAQVM